MPKSKEMTNLEELFIHELEDLYSAEQQILKALPKMADAAVSDELRQALEEHLEQTRNQVSRLEQIFEELGEEPENMVCKGMKGLIEEGKEVIKDSEEDNAVRDAALIMAAQRVEHYEISGYGSARHHAKILGHKQAESLLSETLEEEKEADKMLNDLAINSINQQAE